MHLKYNRPFFRDFWQLLKPYWCSEEKGTAWLLLSLIILCVVGEVRASVGYNNFHRDFFNALQVVNKAAIATALWHFLGVVTGYVLCLGANVYFTGILALRWRRWLTQTYLKKWLDNRRQMLNNPLDNPDQRISEDLEKFPTSTLSLFQKFSHSILMLFSFSIILWYLSKDFSFTMGSTHIAMPGFFYFVAMIYAIIGTYFMSWMGKLLPYLDYKNQQYNADFRFSLMKIREEKVIVPLERKQFDGLFDRIFSNVTHTVALKTRIMFYDKGYSVAAYIIGYLISMPLFIANKMQLGGVAQTSSAFNSVVSAFSFFIESFNSLADWRSVIHRLVEFNKSMDVGDRVALPVIEEPCYEK